VRARVRLPGTGARGGPADSVVLPRTADRTPPPTGNGGGTGASPRRPGPPQTRAGGLETALSRIRSGALPHRRPPHPFVSGGTAPTVGWGARGRTVPASDGNIHVHILHTRPVLDTDGVLLFISCCCCWIQCVSHGSFLVLDTRTGGSPPPLPGPSPVPLETKGWGCWPLRPPTGDTTEVRQVCCGERRFGDSVPPSRVSGAPTRPTTVRASSDPSPTPLPRACPPSGSDPSPGAGRTEPASIPTPSSYRLPVRIDSPSDANRRSACRRCRFGVNTLGF
jgi:hypothetical protein